MCGHQVVHGGRSARPVLRTGHGSGSKVTKDASKVPQVGTITTEAYRMHVVVCHGETSHLCLNLVMWRNV